MTVTEDRTTALLDPSSQDRAGDTGGASAPQVQAPAPAVRSDPDLRSMRWALLVSFLLGVYAAAFAAFGVWLTP